MRECYSCGSIKTYIAKDGGKHWYRNKPFEQWLCENCNNELIKNPKWHPITNPMTIQKWSKIHNEIWAPRRINFRDKWIFFDRKLRTGCCSWCNNNIFDGSCKRTALHHIKYHEDDPLKDTIELCGSCHVRESWRLGQIVNVGRKKMN